MLSYIWNKRGVFPGDVYNRPYPEKLFIYAATRMQQEEDEKQLKEMEKAAKK